MFLSRLSSLGALKAGKGNVVQPRFNFKGLYSQGPAWRSSAWAHTPSQSFEKQKRFLSIHEYQSQKLMRDYGINVPQGSVASSPEEAFNVATALHTPDLVVKAQVLAGGRGLGHFDNGFKGGVHKVSSPEEAKEIAAKMLGHRLFTKQTGPEGKPVNKVLIAKRHYVRREGYFAILLDRTFGGPVMVGSKEGGVDIEKVAEESPNAIVKIGVDLEKGPTNDQTKKMAEAMGFSGAQVSLVRTYP